MSKDEIDSSNGSTLNRMELPLIDLPGSHPCHNCGDCCSYIATEIDNPTTFSDYENLHWYLAHRDISVYIDEESDWFIEFKTECEHLTEAKTCGIYEDRPKICEDFSWTECEKNSNERAWKYYFSSYPDLVDWMQKRRPKAYDNYTKQRTKMLEKRAKSARGKKTQVAAATLSA